MDWGGDRSLAWQACFPGPRGTERGLSMHAPSARAMELSCSSRRYVLLRQQVQMALQKLQRLLVLGWQLRDGQRGSVIDRDTGLLRFYASQRLLDDGWTVTAR